RRDDRGDTGDADPTPDRWQAIRQLGPPERRRRSITLDTYSHVLPGMDAQAADLVAKLILGVAGAFRAVSGEEPLANG
ncbi:MAG: hypothetical protein ACRDKW_01935, partial [Actinomycetota bacterium]